jgi:hypothetical protein
VGSGGSGGPSGTRPMARQVRGGRPLRCARCACCGRCPWGGCAVCAVRAAARGPWVSACCSTAISVALRGHAAWTSAAPKHCCCHRLLFVQTSKAESLNRVQHLVRPPPQHIIMISLRAAHHGMRHSTGCSCHAQSPSPGLHCVPCDHAVWDQESNPYLTPTRPIRVIIEVKQNPCAWGAAGLPGGQCGLRGPPPLRAAGHGAG